MNPFAPPSLRFFLFAVEGQFRLKSRCSKRKSDEETAKQRVCNGNCRSRSVECKHFSVGKWAARLPDKNKRLKYKNREIR